MNYANIQASFRARERNKGKSWVHGEAQKQSWHLYKCLLTYGFTCGDTFALQHSF